MQLIVFSGLPGTGKSSTAEAVGRRLSVPVFAKDHLEATLLRSGVFPKEAGKYHLGYVGYELLSHLAKRQMFLQQSVILDSVVSFERIRAQWRRLAATYSAQWRVIECQCSDQAVHQQRIATRKRSIPGWHELSWEDVQRVSNYYEHWRENRLVLDAMDALEDNMARTMTYLQGS